MSRIFEEIIRSVTMMKKKSLFIWIFILSFHLLWGQNDMHNTHKMHVKRAKKWRITDILGSADSLMIDTTYINYNGRTPMERLSIANSYNGNLGSPIQSKIFFNRPSNSDFYFDNSYYPYISDISNAEFYDVNFPLSNLSYRTSTKSTGKSDHISFLFTAGSNPNNNFGVNLDYIYSLGEYKNQATKRFAGNLFGRYRNKHYSAYGFAVMNKHDNYENGGLKDLALLFNPLSVETKDMATLLTGYSVFKKNQLYYNQKYSIITDQIDKNGDTIHIPLIQFGHRIKYDEMQKRYYEPTVVTDFYENTFNTKATNDTAATRLITNMLSINLTEEYNRTLQFGITAYAENEVQQFTYLQDSTVKNVWKSNTRIGGILSKERGTHLTYRILGDIYLAGYKLGEFRLKGKINSSFKLGKETVQLSAKAEISNETPAFFLQNYNSNHFKWSNQFDKIYRTRLGGILRLPQWHTKIEANVENINNWIYFNTKAMPTQYKGNIQIIALDLEQDFHLYKFVLENRAIYQLTSNDNIVPLPLLSLRHNIYYNDLWLKVLKTQIGVSLHYNTSYYAPSYMPATASFFNQRETQIGDFVVATAYVNFHLKQARLFIEYNHFNQTFMKSSYLSTPNYPINPALFRLGFSWNFYN